MTTTSLITHCPACGTKNRLPVARIGTAGKCGRCAGALATRDFFADAPVEVGEGHFDLLTRSGSRPVFVDFWAGWCAPCRELVPVLEQLARELEGRLLVVKVDSEAAPMLTARYAIQSIPTLVLMRSGIEVDRVLGALPLPALRARVERFLG
jgi:thioredoxin 2